MKLRTGRRPWCYVGQPSKSLWACDVTRDWVSSFSGGSSLAGKSVFRAVDYMLPSADFASGLISLSAAHQNWQIAFSHKLHLVEQFCVEAYVLRAGGFLRRYATCVAIGV